MIVKLFSIKHRERPLLFILIAYILQNMKEEPIVWNNSFSVGYEPLDAQHKELAAMINELIQECEKGTEEAKASIMQAFERSAEYAKTHFATEEHYMLKVGFPKLAEHKKNISVFYLMW